MRKRMRDFDVTQPATARRLRLQLQIYQRDKRRSYKPVSGAGALVTVKNADEQARLMRVVLDAIAAGTWRLPDAPGPAADGSGVADADRLAPLP